MAHKTVGQAADHFDQIVRGLTMKPVIVGHSFGGLLAQILAGRGLSAATVASDPAPFAASAAAVFVAEVGVVRGHALTIDSGRREVADTALAFIRRFV
jgi:pimeloyl-ACP methyl ester carboxylesterase